MSAPIDEADFHFCSGCNRAGEIKGLALSGRHAGITATHAGPELLAELALYEGACLKLFVDSGAFSEVRFSAQGREVVAPISEADWAERLALYARLALIYGEQAFLVMPDSVGDQEETLRRLTRWAPQLHQLAALGAQLILPVQRGAMPAADFLRLALDLTGFRSEEVVLGIPSKKAATTPAELRALCEALRARGVHAPRFHLLGMGLKAKGRPAMLEAIRSSFPEAEVYSDSVGVRSEVGRTNGPGGGPRRLTAAQDRARARGLVRTEVIAAALLETGIEDLRAQAQGYVDEELRAFELLESEVAA